MSESRNGAQPVFARDLDGLRALALGRLAAETLAPLGAAHAVVASVDVMAQISGAADGADIIEGLAELPCPLLAVGPDRTGIPDICDAIVPSEIGLTAILANIGRCPIAATILVQVLRATLQMPPAQALKLESLAYATLQAGPEHASWLRADRRPRAAPAEEPGPAVRMEREGGRLALTLNRPSRHNALSVAMRDALCEALEVAVADGSIETVTISGAGRCFSIGGDLDEFGAAPDPATAHIVRSVRLPAQLLSRCAGRVDFAVQGACIGAGVELPAFGRRVTAARDSFFQLPELVFGLIPGAGGCVSIPRRIGRQRTAYLALSGRRIGAAKALEWGLIDEIGG